MVPARHFNPVVALPFTMYFWSNRKITKIGISETTDIANSEPRELSAVESTNVRSAVVERQRQLAPGLLGRHRDVAAAGSRGGEGFFDDHVGAARIARVTRPAWVKSGLVITTASSRSAAITSSSRSGE